MEGDHSVILKRKSDVYNHKNYLDYNVEDLAEKSMVKVVLACFLNWDLDLLRMVHTDFFRFKLPNGHLTLKIVE